MTSTLHCSFCSKPQGEVKLLAGQANACICSECVLMASDIFTEMEAPSDPTLIRRITPTTKRSKEERSLLLESLRHAINSHSAENQSHTPDFILAKYLMDCLEAYERANAARHEWLGVDALAPGEATEPA